MIAALLLIQATGTRVPIDPPTEAAPERSWSIKADPYANAPYKTERCPETGGDIVVCARPNTDLRLPLPPNVARLKAHANRSPIWTVQKARKRPLAGHSKRAAPPAST